MCDHLKIENTCKLQSTKRARGSTFPPPRLHVPLNFFISVIESMYDLHQNTEIISPIS